MEPACARGRLVGPVTDHDIVVKGLVPSRMPSVCLSHLSQDDAVTVGADDSFDEAPQVGVVQQVRRLPVIDGDRLVGTVSQAVAQEADDPETSATVERMSE